MAGLVNREKREGARKARAEREGAILAAAGHLFLHASFADVTLDAVGQRAGVPRGTPSLYFGSRAVVFLRVLELEVSEWAGDVEARLEALPAGAPPAALARPLAASVAGRPALARLLALLPGALEERGDLSGAVAVVRRIGRVAAGVAAALEGCSPALGQGGGLVLLWRLAAAAIGHDSVAHGAAWLAMLVQKPRLPGGAPPLEEELAAVMEAVLRGDG